ncbi:MAG TPA: glycosyltransferase [Chloroflexi bacterium]|jgi:glycosyltransferase involved in cell wall biosynthesis|nr:glycosyltransferase [Chloroflexota bacterium]
MPEGSGECRAWTTPVDGLAPTLGEPQETTADGQNWPPTISVIIPVYNGAQTIEACLDSLLRQDYPAERYEIIVVENGSTDNTVEIVSRYPVRLLRCARRGPSPARNMGIAKSQADVVAFTDADCVADPSWLSQIVQPYVDPDIGGVGGAILAYHLAERSVVELFCDEQSPLVNYYSGDHEFLPHLFTANASYRRDVIQDVKRFNPRLVTGEDVDLAWRVQCHAGCKLAYMPEAIIYHHHRTTLRGLLRQYRQYGFGEIVLDTMYGGQPGYPRDRRYQLLRVARQIMMLPRYMVALIWRRIHWLRGRISPYEAMLPLLTLIREGSNIYGKLEGLLATRMMTDAEPAMSIQTDRLIERFFTSGRR